MSKKIERIAHQVFGLTPQQIRVAQEGPGSSVAPGQNPAQPESAQVAAEVKSLFQATYDEKGPDGMIALAYSKAAPEVQAEMKGMLEADPDKTIDLMVDALASNPEAVQAWLAFTSELAPQDDAPEAEAPAEPVEEEQPAPEEHEAQGDGEYNEEPEFKVGDAVEPMNLQTGMSEGEPVVVSGIKAGQYLHGVRQAVLGPFAPVEAKYRRVGEKLSGRQVKAMRALVGSSTVDRVLARRKAQMDEMANIADYLSNSLESTSSESMAVQELVELCGVTENQASALVKYGWEKVVPNPMISEDELLAGIASIVSGRQAQRNDIKYYDYVELVDGDIQALANKESISRAEAAAQILASKEDWYKDTIEGKFLADVASGREARKIIAVDQATVGYFQDYFGQYGASLVRPLAFKKMAAKKTAKTAADPSFVQDGWLDHEFDWTTKGMKDGVEYVGGDSYGHPAVGVWDKEMDQYRLFVDVDAALAWAKRHQAKKAQVGDFEASYTLIDAVKHACQRMPADAKTVTGNAGGVIVTFSTESEASEFANFVGRFLAMEHGIGADVKHMSSEGPVPTVLIEETYRTGFKSPSARQATDGKTASNWDSLPWHRKPSSWEEITNSVPSTYPGLDKLETIDEYDLWSGDFGGNFKHPTPDMFIMNTPDYGKFLVDTQGYDYPRYVLKIAGSKLAQQKGGAFWLKADWQGQATTKAKEIEDLLAKQGIQAEFDGIALGEAKFEYMGNLTEAQLKMALPADIEVLGLEPYYPTQAKQAQSVHGLGFGSVEDVLEKSGWVLEMTRGLGDAHFTHSKSGADLHLYLMLQGMSETWLAKVDGQEVYVGESKSEAEEALIMELEKEGLVKVAQMSTWVQVGESPSGDPVMEYKINSLGWKVLIKNTDQGWVWILENGDGQEVDSGGAGADLETAKATAEKYGVDAFHLSSSKKAQSAEKILLVLSPEEQNTAKGDDLVAPIIAKYPSARYGRYEIDDEIWEVYHLPEAIPTVEEVKKYLEADGFEFESQSTAVSGPMDKLIEDMLQTSPGMTVAEAAQKILDSKEGWYKQTPEGEYLMALAGRIEKLPFSVGDKVYNDVLGSLVVVGLDEAQGLVLTRPRYSTTSADNKWVESERLKKEAKKAQSSGSSFMLDVYFKKTDSSDDVQAFNSLMRDIVNSFPFLASYEGEYVDHEDDEEEFAYYFYFKGESTADEEAQLRAALANAKDQHLAQFPESEIKLGDLEDITAESREAQSDDDQVVTIYCEQPVPWAVLEAIEKDWGQEVAQVDEKSFNLHYKPDQDLTALHAKMMKVLADHLEPEGITIREIAP